MKKSVLIISNALVWGAILLACSIALQGTEAFQDIQLILGGGAAVSMLIAAVSGKSDKHNALKQDPEE
jgi:hypothetical protein